MLNYRKFTGKFSKNILDLWGKKEKTLPGSSVVSGNESFQINSVLIKGEG
jgi:hypothetical protein